MSLSDVRACSDGSSSVASQGVVVSNSTTAECSCIVDGSDGGQVDIDVDEGG